MRFNDMVSRAKDAFRFGLGLLLKDFFDIPNTVKGEVFIEMRDAATGALLYSDYQTDSRTVVP